MCKEMGEDLVNGARDWGQGNLDCQEVARWTKTQSETEEQEKKVNGAGTSAV